MSDNDSPLDRVTWMTGPPVNTDAADVMRWMTAVPPSPPSEEANAARDFRTTITAADLVDVTGCSLASAEAAIRARNAQHRMTAADATRALTSLGPIYPKAQAPATDGALIAANVRARRWRTRAEEASAQRTIAYAERDRLAAAIRDLLDAYPDAGFSQGPGCDGLGCGGWTEHAAALQVALTAASSTP